MIKDMDNEALAEYIYNVRVLLANAFECRDGRGVTRLQRSLDIAVAVKRQRQRAGTWATLM